MPAQLGDVEILSLELPARLREELFRRSRDAAPSEACGFLLGDFDGARARSVQATLARNLARSSAHFDAHPEDQLAAERDAERLGLRVLGAWHSHVHAAARPSAADLAHDAYPLALILSLRDSHAAAFAGAREVELRPG